MKKNNFFIIAALAVLFSLIFFACASKPEVIEEEPVPQEIIEEPEVIEEELVEPEPEPEPEDFSGDDDEVEVLLEEDNLSDDEYLRSIAELNELESVSKQEFTDDKHEILDRISELAIIMETKDVLDWLNYIEEESKEYYKNPVNLRKAQRKLRDKRIELKTIQDYFLYVFIPSRQNSQIDEIRYISKTQVNAIQVREDDDDLIYYQFLKENGEWKVYLPRQE